jgi:hypothetical protein
MNNARRRPIGVTLIALMFLWIGCFGTLVFPIFELSGSTSVFWSHILGLKIQSATWIKAISYALDGLWFSLYIVYVVIGFGLWKLKNWARKSVIILSLLAIAAAFVVSAAFVRPILMASCAIGAALVECGWIAWYLMRPRVQYAFGAWNRYSPAGDWVEPPGLSKRGKVGVGALVVTSGFVLFVIPLFILVESEMRSSEAYKLTMHTAQASPCVLNALGSPLETGYMLSGSISESSTEGSAQLDIPVKGPKGKGELDMEAKKFHGIWKLDSLVFTHGVSRSVLVPSDSSSACL